MRVVLSTLGKFHTFDLARELHKRDALVRIFTAYPRFKLRHESLPSNKIGTFPWVHTPYMALVAREYLGAGLMRAWEWLDRVSLDAHVARHLPECDVFVGLSSSALRTGRVAHRRGARYVCDRGSTHIREQDHLLREEHDRWGISYPGIDTRIMEREEAEYAEADCITVPSDFNVRSFLKHGVPRDKIRRLPYGVDLTRFHPTSQPSAASFDVLFVGAMSVRKGVPYLLQAFKKLRHAKKSLTFAGAVSADLMAKWRALKLWPEQVRVLGHLDQSELRDAMSRSHVMVLPSIEEGLALVQAQAMACGCPVIGTTNTGAEDLFADGQGGYIAPIRDSDAIADRLQVLADNPELRLQMSKRAMDTVHRAGGWREYGDKAFAIYQELCG